MILAKIKKDKKGNENIVLKLEHDPNEADGKFSELESFWNSIHTLQDKGKFWFNKKQTPIYSFEILSDKEGAKFYFSIPKQYKNIIAKKLNAVYPYIEINEVEEDPIKKFKELNDEFIESFELRLTEHYSQPLKLKDSTQTFLNNLLNSINHSDEEEISLIQVLVKPLPESWNKKQMTMKIGKFHNSNIVVKILVYILGVIITSLAMLVSGGKIGSMKDITNQNNKEDKTEEQKFGKPCFNVSIRLATKSKDLIIAKENAKSISSAFTNLDNKNSLRPIKINFSYIEEREMNKRKMKNQVFNSTELTQVTSLPGAKVNADNVIKTSIKMPYDNNVPTKGIVFGISNKKPVAFPMIPLSKEKYKELHEKYEKIIDNICKPRLVLGQMGTGKSEWIINYAISLAKMGVGLIVVDPKNDTQQRLIESLPDELMHLVDYIDLGDLAYPAAMNIFRKRKKNDPTEISLIVTSLINFFKKEFGKSWGFAMQQLIQMTGNAILLDDVSTLYEFQLMLTSKEYREKIINKMEEMLEDKNTKSKVMLKELLHYWKQFNSMSPKEQRTTISSTMNKIGVFMANRLIRAIVSQRESYDFRKAGDEGRITIINIPEGILNPENTRLLASFINKAIWLDFQSRAEISIHERYPTVWLIEEAHEVIDEEFIGVLTKSRGYRLGVTILTQGLTNFDNKGMKEIKELILTNCKNKILFRLGHQDARALAEEMSVTPFDLMNLPDYHFYGKILLDGGKVSNTFFAKSLPPAEVLRSYDEFKYNHKSGKLSIDEIEEELDKRHNIQNTLTIYNMSSNEEEDTNMQEVNDVKSKKRMNSPIKVLQ